MVRQQDVMPIGIFIFFLIAWLADRRSKDRGPSKSDSGGGDSGSDVGHADCGGHGGDSGDCGGDGGGH